MPDVLLAQAAVQSRPVFERRVAVPRLLEVLVLLALRVDTVIAELAVLEAEQELLVEALAQRLGVVLQEGLDVAQPRGSLGDRVRGTGRGGRSPCCRPGAPPSPGTRSPTSPPADTTRHDTTRGDATVQ